MKLRIAIFLTAMVPFVFFGDVSAETKYGVHSYIEYNGNEEKLAEHITEIKKTNAQISRVGFAWNRIEPVKGTRDWSWPDKVVDGLIAEGIEPLMPIAQSPQWANGSSDRLYVPTAEPEFSNWLAEYRLFAHDLAVRYHDRVKHWELWNEPNLPSSWKPAPNIEQYARWSAAISQEIKGVDPDAKIAFGSLCILDVDYGSGQISGRNFLQGLYDRGVFPDVVSVHPYTWGNEAPDQYSPGDGINTFRDVQTIKNLMDAKGQVGKEIWITEWGWKAGETAGGITMTESLQEQYLKRSLQIIRDEYPYVTKATWFWDYDMFTTFEGYGLVRADKTLRPAGTTFRDFNRTSPNSISADPNPCVIQPGQTRCNSSISWTTLNQPHASVFIKETGANFSGPDRPSGSNVQAPWINSVGFTFELHAENNIGSTLLDSVFVRGIRDLVLPAAPGTLSVR